LLNQFPRNSRHVSRLRCKRVPIFLEEFDEHEFIFGIQTVAYVSNLGRILRGQWNHIAECVLRLDGCLGGLGLGHDRVWGGHSQGLLQLLELYGRRRSVICLATLPVTIKSPLDVSPDGDAATRPWDLQDQVGVMCDRHELGDCWLSQESIVRSLEIGNLKLYSLRAEIFLSPEGYGKRDMTDGGHCCTRDYAMERSLTGSQQRPGYTHLVNCL
jgi:hypothetical protein